MVDATPQSTEMPGVDAGLSWLEPIVMKWQFSKSNGATESLHTKMEMNCAADCEYHLTALKSMPLQSKSSASQIPFE